jgi:membrane-bound serine protease (ClpP class)
LRRLSALLLVLLAALLWATPSSAQSDAGDATDDDLQLDEGAHIDVVQVEGNIDPVMSDLIVDSLDDAARTGATVVILQINSPGALDTDVDRILAAITESPVPVAAWVGPAKSSARGLAAEIVVQAAHISAVSTKSKIGPIQPMRLDRGGDGTVRESETLARVDAGRVSGKEALQLKLVDFEAPTLGDLLVGLDGRTVTTTDGSTKLSVAKTIKTDDGPRRTANQPVRFLKLGTFEGVQHSLTSPSVAYLLLVVGLALMVFEFFTLGIGLAGVTGALALCGSFFAFSHLPVNPFALGLILVSTLGFAIDVQASRQAFWTGVGLVTLILGSLWLYDGSSVLDIPLWLLVLGVLGQVVFMLGAMTVAVRNRCAVPTVGRDSMIGETGEVHTELDPEGVVLVRGAPWRARTRRARRLPPGTGVKIVAVDQLVLEVEPADA